MAESASMPQPPFMPRQAALRHAARVQDKDQQELASAIACGLVAVCEALDNLYGILETLDRTVNDRLLGIEEAQ